MRNIRLNICYDGSRYQGWQRQAGNPNTIQGRIETALSRILGQPTEITGSGRTDTGVHAKGQVANFHTDSAMPADQILSDFGSICRRISAYNPVKTVPSGSTPD